MKEPIWAAGGIVARPCLALIGERVTVEAIPATAITIQGGWPTMADMDQLWHGLVRAGRRAGVRFA